jgi:hypothetical protein
MLQEIVIDIFRFCAPSQRPDSDSHPLAPDQFCYDSEITEICPGKRKTSLTFLYMAQLLETAVVLHEIPVVGNAIHLVIVHILPHA